MKPTRKPCMLAALGVATAMLAAPAGHAAEIAAVLSSNLGPYLEALAGFRDTLDRPVDVFNLGDGAPALDRATRVLVAFGGRAALQPWPGDVTLVVCLAPGTQPDRDARRTVVVHMLPEPATATARIVELQPGLRRLAVLWCSEGLTSDVQEITRAAHRVGIELLADRLVDAAALPERLRHVSAKRAEAVWLLNDPLLVSAASLTLLREFSWANDVPFFAPNPGLVEQGATASVSVGFRDCGREAARAAGDALGGRTGPGDLWPARCEVTVNLNAATSAGLQLPPATLQKADRVLP